MWCGMIEAFITGAARHEMMRCRSGIVTHPEFDIDHA
jgi:hypothetical protein